MRDEDKSREQLLKELKELRRQTQEEVTKGSALFSEARPAGTAGRKTNTIQVSGIQMEWDPKGGTCTFEKLPVAMMWVDTTLAGLMSGVQAMVGTERFLLALQSEGRKSVETDWRVISKFSDFSQGFKAIANIAGVAGWGLWELISLDNERKECRFRVADSWEGLYQKALGVCWGSGMLAGKLAGYCTKLFRTNCWAEQTGFIAKGDPYDEFIVRTSSRSIEQEIENLLASDDATRADMAVAVRKLEKEIAERQRAESELREAHQKLQAIIQASPLSIFVLDPEGKVLLWNPASEQTFGWTEAEAVGRVLPIVPEEKLDEFRDNLRRALAGESLCGVELRRHKKDGTPINLSIYTSTLYDTQGRATGVMALNADITERKQAEEFLKLNELRLEALVNLNQMANAPLAEITHFAMEEATRLTGSKIGYVAFMNEDETVLTMHAWSIAAMAECRIADKPLLYPVETTGLWGEAVRQRKPIITNDYAAPNPWKKGYPQGHVSVLRHMNVPIFDGEKVVIVAGVGNKPSDYDESDVRQLTLLMEGMWRIVQRKQAADKLEQSISLLQATLESTADGLLVIDRSGKIVAYNQKFARMWRIPEEVLASRDDERALVFVLEQLGDPEGFLSKVRELYNQPEAESYDLIEFKDGRVFERYSQPQRIGQALVGRVWSFRDITERMRADEALRESREDLNRAQAVAHTGSWQLDTQRNELLWSDETHRIFGIPKGTPLTYESFLAAVHPEDRVYVDKKWTAALQGEPYDIEHRILVNGTVKWVRERAEMEFDSQGLLRGGFGTVQDITERKQAEEALRESEAKYRLLFESNPQPLWVYDLESLAFLKVNQAAVDIYGYSREEFLAMTIKEIRPREDTAPLLKKVEEVKEFTPGLGYSGEWRHVKKSGEIIKVEIVSHEIAFNGRRARLVMAKDITARKAAEEALRESELKYRHLFESSAEGFFLMTDIFLDCNEQACKLWKCDREDIVGHSPVDFSPEFQPDGRRSMEAAQEYIVAAFGGTPQFFYWQHRRKDGVLIDTEISLKSVTVSGKQILQATMRDITERKAAEAALRESEEKYRILVNQIPAVVFKGYVDWSVDFFDNKIEELTGYSKEEFDSRRLKWSKVILADDLPQVKRKSIEIIKTRTRTYEREYRIRKKDGGIAWLQAMGQIFYNAAGKLDYVSGVFIDISERKRAEEALLKYEFIANAAEDCMTLIDRNYVYEAVNAAYCQAHGKTREEVVGSSVAQIWGGDTFEKVIQGYLDRCFTGQRVEFEGWFAFGKRGLGCYHVSYSPYFDAHGRVAYAAVVSHETSERKRVEEALRQSDAKYRQLVDQIPAVVYRGYVDWSLDCFDRKIENITGYSMEDFNSRRKIWLNLIFPEDIDQAKNLLKEALKGDGSYVTEHRIRKKNGEVRWIQARNRVIRDAAGKIDYISGVFFDITERKELEDQLIKAQRMEAIGILAGGLAHDFNNLLTAIMGYSEMMTLELRKEDPFYLYIKEIIKAANRGAALTNQLLAFSRKQIMQPRVINLNEVVLDMDKMLRRLIGEDIELLTFVDQKLGLVKADPAQIEQIIMNLAVNARDAMPNGGKVTVETANVYLDEAYARSHVGITPGPHVMLAVSDSGLGMDAETMSRIFEPFFTTKESGKGTGLGLATVYGIVKQSGGHIWVYSEPNKGTTFKVYLPRAEERAEELKAKVTAPTSLEGTETILVVEDDTALRELISAALRRYGFKMLEAAHGGEALLICERQEAPIHLMLTDVVMPQISGTALAERLKRLHPEMKVLYMSGYTENAIVHHGVMDAKVNFIPKPFRVLALVQKVREVLDSPEKDSPATIH